MASPRAATEGTRPFHQSACGNVTRWRTVGISYCVVDSSDRVLNRFYLGGCQVASGDSKDVAEGFAKLRPIVRQSNGRRPAAENLPKGTKRAAIAPCINQGIDRGGKVGCGSDRVHGHDVRDLGRATNLRDHKLSANVTRRILRGRQSQPECVRSTKRLAPHTSRAGPAICCRDRWDCRRG